MPSLIYAVGPTYLLQPAKGELYGMNCICLGIRNLWNEANIVHVALTMEKK